MRAVNILQSLIPVVLTDALRSKRYRGNPNRLAGHCYVASEAAYHALGGKRAGWTPQFIRHEGEPHWFLKHVSGTVLDITRSQFRTMPRYCEARGKGFLTAAPSKRARVVLDSLNLNHVPRSN